jgi:signal transduction histidine kinase
MTTELLNAHRGELSPEAREALDLLAGDVHTFQSLVEDLLEMARADAGSDGLVIETLGVHELVHQCVLAATRRHQLPSTTVIVAPSALSTLVAVDRRRFERIVTNLLENGYRYGGGTVLIHVAQSDDRVEIDVDDDGPGVLASDRERVFERFYRGASAGARGDQRGSGLGLALVAEHMARFGGTVEILDAALGGCRVRLTLPVAPEEAL